VACEAGRRLVGMGVQTVKPDPRVRRDGLCAEGLDRMERQAGWRRQRAHSIGLAGRPDEPEDEVALSAEDAEVSG